jgi:hypothetical protein
MYKYGKCFNLLLQSDRPNVSLWEQLFERVMLFPMFDVGRSDVNRASESHAKKLAEQHNFRYANPQSSSCSKLRREQLQLFDNLLFRQKQPHTAKMGRVRTKTVKKSAKVIIERYYPKLTLDFETNKRICDEIAIIASKRLRNKVRRHRLLFIAKGPSF